MSSIYIFSNSYAWNARLPTLFFRILTPASLYICPFPFCRFLYVSSFSVLFEKSTTGSFTNKKSRIYPPNKIGPFFVNRKIPVCVCVGNLENLYKSIHESSFPFFWFQTKISEIFFFFSICCCSSLIERTDRFSNFGAKNQIFSTLFNTLWLASWRQREVKSRYVHGARVRFIFTSHARKTTSTRYILKKKKKRWILFCFVCVSR